MRRRLKIDQLIAPIFPGTSPTGWCAGRWTGLYQLMTPWTGHSGAFRPRLTIAVKPFRIG